MDTSVTEAEEHPAQEEPDETPTPGDDGSEHVADLLAGYALGALDPEETELVARHVQSCASCRAALSGYEQVGSLLPYAAPVQPVPLRARAALLNAIDALGTGNDAQLIVLAAPKADDRTWLRRHPRLLAVASFAAVVTMMLGAMLAMGERNNQLEAQIEQIAEEKDAAQRVLMDVPTPVSPRFMVELITTPAGGSAKGRLFVDHGINEAMLLAVKLPRPADDARYVVWLQLFGRTEYARAGVLDIDEQNRAQLTIQPRDALASYDMIVVTVEPDEDVPAPTGPEIMTAGLVPPQ